MKMDKKEPSLVGFRNVIWKQYRVEKYIAVQLQFLESFLQKWYKYRGILNEI